MVFSVKRKKKTVYLVRIFKQFLLIVDASKKHDAACFSFLLVDKLHFKLFQKRTHLNYVQINPVVVQRKRYPASQ